MPFYKKEDDQLLSGNSVYGPGFTLLEQEHEAHTYPVDGWYWFANLDAAMLGMAGSGNTVCGPLQLRKALRQLNMIDAVKTVVASASEEIQEAWEYASEFKRNDPMIEAIRVSLGKTEKEIDDLFTLAITL